MENQRVYADLNKWEEVNKQFRVILTTRGTHQDLQRYGITLEEGLTLDFWMDDGDVNGNPDPLYFQGIVHYNEDAQHWVAVVVREEIRNASELRGAEDNAPISSRSDIINIPVEHTEIILKSSKKANPASEQPIKI